MDKIGSDKSNNDSLSISNSCHKPRLSTCMAHGFHSLIYYKMPRKVVALILPHHFQRLKKSRTSFHNQSALLENCNTWNTKHTRTY